jgi:dolichyl-phosphate-mannose--protein O-mannosyl transferase
VGIDSWDSLGHLIAFLGSGRYSLTEPFLWLVRNGQIMASPNPFPPGYFSLMGATSMLLQVDPLTLTKSVFLFGVLQTLFIYLLTKKLTGDTTKSLIAALLIACGTATSENIKLQAVPYRQ